MNSFLTPKQEIEYKRLHKACKKIKHADRIKAILMLNKGYSFTEVAEILLVDDDTIRTWYGRYLDGGTEDLLEDHHIGGFSFLTCEQKEELCEHLRAYTYLRAADICIHVEETYKVCYTVKGMQALLKHMGFSYKKPKHVPGKTDKQKQEQFIKEYERLMRTKAEEDKVYFMDGMHPMHNSQPAYGWIKKGEEKQLKANTGRQRLNLNGAYNIEDHKVVIKEEDRIDANAIVSLLRAIKKRQRQGISYVILDNAPYNRSRIVQMFVTENPQIKLIYLPPYSPNLNLIERLWKFFRKNITYNRYYEKFSVFKEESMDFFKNINIHRNELRSLMTQNFELIC